MAGFNGFPDASPLASAPQTPIVPVAAPSDVLGYAKGQKIPERVTKALLMAIGVDALELEEVMVDDFALTPESAITEAIASLLVEGAPATGIQQGQALRLYRAAKLKVTAAGLGDVWNPTAVAAAPPPSAPAAPAPPPAPTKKIAEVLDQTDDSHFPLLGRAELDKMRDRFEQIIGDEPTDDERPTADQLSALTHKLAQGRPPYVDLALFGPFSDRIARIRKFSAQIWVDNQLKTTSLVGPSTYEAWCSSWAVFRAAMIMVGAADVAALDRYSRGIKRLVDLHGSWPIIMVAEERCRQERWDILAETFSRKATEGFDRQRPWNYVIGASAYSPTSGPLAEWWYYQVVAPLTYKVGSPVASVNTFEGTTGSVTETIDVAVGGRAIGGMKPTRAFEQSAGGGGWNKSPGKPKKSGGGKGASQGGAAASSNIQSNEFCMNWNNGGCSKPCPGGRKHLCSTCGGPHRRTECPVGRPKGNGKGPTGGDNNSKGKSGGGSQNKKKKQNKSAGAGAGAPRT